MNRTLINAAKRILKRRYDVECTEPFAGVDRFSRTTGNSVAQIDLEAVKGGPVYKLNLVGFCYDNDAKYEEEKQIKTTESTNPKDLAELIDEFLSKIETKLAILVKQHRQDSEKKRILSVDEAIDILNSAGLSVISEESVKKIQLSDKFRTAWNSLMYAMSDFTDWNRIVMWYVGNKYEKKATSLSEAYARGRYSLHEIIEKMKFAGSKWYRDLLSKINAILRKNNLEVTSASGEFSYRDETYKILPVAKGTTACSFEIRENSDVDDVYRRTPFIEDPDDALDALEALIEEEF